MPARQFLPVSGRLFADRAALGIGFRVLTVRILPNRSIPLRIGRPGLARRLLYLS